MAVPFYFTIAQFARHYQCDRNSDIQTPAYRAYRAEYSGRTCIEVSNLNPAEPGYPVPTCNFAAYPGYPGTR
eukprot:2914102-Rhodomonas_salina.1